jgi:hypothetical protein
MFPTLWARDTRRVIPGSRLLPTCRTAALQSGSRPGMLARPQSSSVPNSLFVRGLDLTHHPPPSARPAVSRSGRHRLFRSTWTEEPTFAFEK